MARYVTPLLARGVDTLVLGCTHYPFLNSILKDIAGPAVTLIDPAAAVARELSRRLASEHLLTQNLAPGTERFWSSGAAWVLLGEYLGSLITTHLPERI